MVALLGLIGGSSTSTVHFTGFFIALPLFLTD
jgi:hypothetical protein